MDISSKIKVTGSGLNDVHLKGWTMTDWIRRAAETILGDSALTDYLDDTEAIRLNEWGVSLAKEIAATALSMDTAQAETYLEENLKMVRRTMRKINRLVGDLGTLADDEVSEKLEDILESGEAIAGLSAARPGHLKSEAMVLARSSKADALTRLLEYFSRPAGGTAAAAGTGSSPQPAPDLGPLSGSDDDTRQFRFNLKPRKPDSRGEE
jgi:hypothetical protein